MNSQLRASMCCVQVGISPGNAVSETQNSNISRGHATRVPQKVSSLLLHGPCPPSPQPLQMSWPRFAHDCAYYPAYIIIYCEVSLKLKSLNPRIVWNRTQDQSSIVKRLVKYNFFVSIMHGSHVFHGVARVLDRDSPGLMFCLQQQIRLGLELALLN